jgi:cell division FtsZ-interacting protein ZapD
MDLFNKNKVEELQSELAAAESRIQALSTFENLEAEQLSSLVSELRAEKGRLIQTYKLLKFQLQNLENCWPKQMI